jgi:hypothetical protein
MQLVQKLNILGLDFFLNYNKLFVTYKNLYTFISHFSLYYIQVHTQVYALTLHGFFVEHVQCRLKGQSSEILIQFF